jgi:hypothetical protein
VLSEISRQLVFPALVHPRGSVARTSSLFGSLNASPASVVAHSYHSPADIAGCVGDRCACPRCGCFQGRCLSLRVFRSCGTGRLQLTYCCVRAGLQCSHRTVPALPIRDALAPHRRQSDRDTTRIALKNPSVSGTVARRPSFVTIGCRRSHCFRAGFGSASNANAGHIAVNGASLAENRRIILAIQCPFFAGAGRRSFHFAR